MLCFRNGPRFKSEGAGQLRISPMMGWQLTPYVTSRDRIKIGQPPWLPRKIVGQADCTRRDGTRTSGASVQSPREQVPRSRTTADGRVAVASRIGLGTGSSRDSW
jgi:hypothetical protein